MGKRAGKAIVEFTEPVKLLDHAEAMISSEENKSDSIKEIKGFEYLDAAEGWLPAKAALDAGGRAVLLETAESTAETVQGVRFAWNDCPLEANLYSESGLPVVPFCMENMEMANSARKESVFPMQVSLEKVRTK